MNRWLYCFTAVLLLVCGCSSGSAVPAPSPASATPGVSPATSLLQETLTVSGSDSLSGFTATSGLLPHHMISIGPDAELNADSLSLDKVDNGAVAVSDDSLYTGSEALIFTDRSVLRITNSMISGTAPYAHALFLGNQSSCFMDRSVLVTTDVGQAAVAVFDASNVEMTDCILAATGDGASCLMLMDSRAYAEKAELTVRDSRTSFSVSLKSSSLSLANSTVSGNMQYTDLNTLDCTDSAVTGELFAESSESELALSLKNGSVLTGCSYDDSLMSLHVSLDASSSWVLTEDSFVARFEDDDQSLSNLISNGFSLYYNSEYEGNEWLSGRTLSLPGGGYLIPLI